MKKRMKKKQAKRIKEQDDFAKMLAEIALNIDTYCEKAFGEEWRHWKQGLSPDEIARMNQK